MNDLPTLKSLTSIKPIATLCNVPCDRTFNRFFFERVAAHGKHENGIVLTISDDAVEDIEEWAEYITQPVGTVRVKRLVTESDLIGLSLDCSAPVLRQRGITNYASMLSDDVAIFKFATARWRGQEYPIGILNRYFNRLRRAFYLSDQAGVIDFVVSLGSVNHRYTSRAQMEETLYPMAYYFFREDTEL